MALPGINNANEFYSAHYLESVLTNDIKKVRERWTEAATAQLQAHPLADVSTPEAQFKALRKPWQKLREAELGITAEPVERLRLQRELFFQALCEALGYPYAPKAEPVLIGGEAYQIPLLGEVNNAKGEPWLWVVECFNPSDEPADPLELTIATSWACQINDPSLGLVLEGETWEELISERIFAQDIPPRWVLAVSRDQLLLIDRQKWAASRLLRFELDTLLGENNPDAVLAAATLLHREHTCPTGGGTPLLDELDENSHKHAYEVSGDLKYALRKSIELLGNEAIHWRRSKGEGVFKGKTDADQLTLECLRYMYRLLFLFYIESRPDLGYAPMGSDVYRLGYSLESLRDMDTAELGSEEDKESTYISDSLDRLFQMIWEGYPKRDDETAQLPLADADDLFHDSFRLTPLKAHLFDPERMPTLTRVRFRNVVLREVIELMSLTKEGKGKRRGRVSYSQLGINQLGAVYEALLSFRGFFAEEDLYEVQPAPKKGKAAKASDDDDLDEDGDDSTKASGHAHDELEVGHFVTAEQLKAYKSEEIVPDAGTGKPKCYPKGSFIYRLAGRDREKSASYYTPESLTQCLVKYALKELLPGKSAADILQLKVCEPAMGSAAFLNEVVNQLAQKYLELRQQETGKSIPHEQFATELQKVKMRLADQNVFGVDLNPVAVELAEVSLWLNSIFTPENGRAFVPWFSQQLVCGNSLIGARRQIYRVNQLPTIGGRKAKPTKLWHEHAPEKLAWDAELPDDAIFHFLLPDPGMAAYSDKVIKELEPDAIERCKRWNKAFVGEAFTEVQIAHLLRLSKLVDALWTDWATQQQQLRERTTDPLPVWEDPTGAQEGDWTPLKLKDRIQEQEVQGRDVANTNARLRLKWAMDYWVALWFWPIHYSGDLPSRDQWLLELSMILGDLELGIEPTHGQQDIFPDTQSMESATEFADRHGFVDAERLKTRFSRLQLVERLESEVHPLHWDLEFADMLSIGGFDLFIGNPPWIRPSWKPEDFWRDHSPILSGLFNRKTKSSEQVNSLRASSQLKEEYQSQFIAAFSQAAMLKRLHGASLDSNMNLYKCFFVQSARLSKRGGVCAFIHDSGTYESINESNLRRFLYKRLIKLFRFENQLKLFSELGNARAFECTIFRPAPAEVIQFDALSGLYHPCTVTESYESIEDFSQKSPRYLNGWNVTGSTSKIIEIDRSTLETMSILLNGGADGWDATQILAPHNKSEMSLLSSLADGFSGGNRPRFTESPPVPEKASIDQGILEESPAFLEKGLYSVLSGPNTYLGKCFYQSCDNPYLSHRSYTPLPNHIIKVEPHQMRVRYKIRNISEFQRRYDPLLVSSSQDRAQHQRLSSQYRLGLRKMLDDNEERTIKPFILPPNLCHVESITSIAFERNDDLLVWCGLMSSILFDYLFRRLGKSSFYPSDLKTLGLPDSLKVGSLLRDNVIAHALCLNASNIAYQELCDSISFSGFSISQDLKTICAGDLYKDPIRNWPQRQPMDPLTRVQCLAEIDVLAAKALGVSLRDLLACFELGFKTAQKLESETFFDRNGQVVFSQSRAIGYYSLPRKTGKKSGLPDWEHVRDKEDNFAVTHAFTENATSDDAAHYEIKFEPPYQRFERNEFYRKYWEYLDE